MGPLFFYRTIKITKLRATLFVLVLALASYASALRAEDEPALPIEPISSETGDVAGYDVNAAPAPAPMPMQLVDRKPGFSPITVEGEVENGNYLDYSDQR